MVAQTRLLTSRVCTKLFDKEKTLLLYDFSLLPAEVLAVALSAFHGCRSVSCSAFPAYFHVESVFLGKSLFERVQYRHLLILCFAAETENAPCQIYFLPTRSIDSWGVVWLRLYDLQETVTVILLQSWPPACFDDGGCPMRHVNYDGVQLVIIGRLLAFFVSARQISPKHQDAQYSCAKRF
jgi:hypothetical protein